MTNKIFIFKKIRYIFINIINVILFTGISLFRTVDSKKVVFESFRGRSYSCNPRAISEKLHKELPDMKVIWLFNNPHQKKDIPNYVKAVKKKSIRAYYELYTSKFLIDNFQKPYRYKKRKEQIYIQTWHGDRAFKKILYDKETNEDSQTMKLIENEICDLMIAGSTFGEKLLRSAFKYNGEILNCGSARNDILISKDEILTKEIKNKLGISANKRIVLFAPTFREKELRKTQKIEELDLNQILKKLEIKYSSEWLFLVRSHSNAAGLNFTKGLSKNVLEVSDYEDMADLLLISDMLITDYSSSAGDFVLRNKPVILFQPDRDEYEENEREFYIPIEETPFFVANNQNELINLIDSLDEKTVIQNCENVMKFYGFKETGNASGRVVEYIKSCK